MYAVLMLNLRSTHEPLHSFEQDAPQYNNPKIADVAVVILGFVELVTKIDSMTNADNASATAIFPPVTKQYSGRNMQLRVTKDAAHGGGKGRPSF